MEPLTLILSIGRDAPEGLDALLGVALGALVLVVLRALTYRAWS